MMEHDQLHQLVDGLVERRQIETAAVERALRAVPRHLFLPGVDLAQVYRDAPVPVAGPDGELRTINAAPFLMATMLEQLQPAPGMSVLEIGAGTGYGAALLAELVGPTGQVVTVDVDPETCAGARANLAAAGYPAVQVVGGDGALGHWAGGPYDRIIATVGISELSPHWMEQLHVGGRLTLPLWFRGVEFIVTFVREGDILRSTALSGGEFMRARGMAAGTGERVGLDGGWWASSDDAAQLDRAALQALLAQEPGRDAAIPAAPGARCFVHGFGLFMAAREVRTLWLTRKGSDGHLWGPALFDPASGSLCALLWRWGATEQPPELWSFGGEGAAWDLRAHYRAWLAAGRPPLQAATIRVGLGAAALLPAPGAVPRRWYSFAFAWEGQTERISSASWPDR